ncbi:acetolactate synthase large subunit [Salarchaeum sp. III]|uniref:acetolactate synthase large subunit n=1 Tax=Salarchaeum sp. III TaxID=3107927 RepID=UPI002EDAC3A5
MNAADLLVACLEREGVEHVFGLPGEETDDLLFALRDSDVTFVPVRHEQGAAFMADVHGRLTGEAGVCLATLGPGATNLLTGVADAHLDKSPLVAITAQAGLERLHKESHQALDIVNMFESVTKWNTTIRDPDIVNEAARKAFKLAEYEKPGATHLELPEDIAAQGTVGEPLPERGPVPRPRPNEDAVDAAADLLAEADRPVVLAGNGAVRARSSDQLREFVTEHGVPVVSTYMGKGAVSDANDHSLMTLDSGDGAAQDALAAADLVVAVGYDIAEHDPASFHRSGVPIIHIDSEPAEVYEAYDPAVELVADIAHSLDALAGRADAGFDGAWFDEYRERIVDRVLDADPRGNAPFSVDGVLPVVRDALGDEDVLVSDVGNHKMSIAQRYPTYAPNTCIISNGLASMGIAVPGAVSADLAVDGNVLAATGDGGFLMNAAELETATRLGCSFTVLVFRDDDYGLISAKQQRDRGQSFGTRLSNPDFVAFAESFGVNATRPETRDALETAIGDAVASDDLELVEVPLVSRGPNQ